MLQKVGMQTATFSLWVVKYNTPYAGLLVYYQGVKIYNNNIEVVSFVIGFGSNRTIVVKFEVNVKKCGRGNSFCSLFVFQDIWGYINGIQIAKFGLLIERTSSIYLKVR